MRVSACTRVLYLFIYRSFFLSFAKQNFVAARFDIILSRVFYFCRLARDQTYGTIRTRHRFAFEVCALLFSLSFMLHCSIARSYLIECCSTGIVFLFSYFIYIVQCSLWQRTHLNFSRDRNKKKDTKLNSNNEREKRPTESKWKARQKSNSTNREWTKNKKHCVPVRAPYTIWKVQTFIYRNYYEADIAKSMPDAIRKRKINVHNLHLVLRKKV